MQLAGALMVVLPMEHAHVAGWCSCDGVADGACCKLALSTINGIEVLPACALVRSRWRY